VVEERAELGGGQAAVGCQYLGPVVVVADPQVAECVELHLDGRLGTEHEQLAARRTPAAQMAVDRRAIGTLGLLDGALAHQDIDDGARPAPGHLAPEHLGSIEDGARNSTQAAAIFAMPRVERVDAAAPEPAEPRPQRAARGRDLTAARMRVALARERSNPRAQRAVLALVEQWRDHAVAEQCLGTRMVVITCTSLTAHRMIARRATAIRGIGAFGIARRSVVAVHRTVGAHSVVVAARSWCAHAIKKSPPLIAVGTVGAASAGMNRSACARPGGGRPCKLASASSNASTASARVPRAVSRADREIRGVGNAGNTGWSAAWTSTRDSRAGSAAATRAIQRPSVPRSQVCSRATALGPPLTTTCVTARAMTHAW
jgi:hypothetical protein